MSKKFITNPEIALDAKVLYDLFKTKDSGQVVSYAEMHERVPGRDFTNGDRGILVKARNMLLRSDRIVTRAERGQGIKILGDESIVGIGDEASARIRRISRRSSAEITCVKNFSALSPDMKAKHNASLGLLGAISLMTQPKRMEKLQEKCQSEQMATKSVLQLFAQ